MSNDQLSVGRAQHFEPTFFLYGRVAADIVGYATFPKTSLHLSLIIYDGYSTTVIDGQPTMAEAGLRNSLRIRTNVSTTSIPKDVLVAIPLQPPQGTTPRAFANELIVKATNFASYVVPYKTPKMVLGNKMKPNEYNSSSYLAALLRSVYGYVPQISVQGYQIPGWEMPMPTHFFKGEAIR